MLGQDRPLATDEKVRALLRRKPPGAAPSIEQAARRMGMSPRTLQRRLAGQGLTFRRLVDEVRLEGAVNLLIGSELPITEISARLGYSTPSGFCRAFSRWTGRSPSEIRRVTRTGSRA